MKSSRFLNLLIMVALIVGVLSTPVGAAPVAQGTEKQPEAACALLDDPTTRGLMSAMFETKLLIACGRTDELRFEGSGAPAPEAPGGALQTDVLVNNPGGDIGQSTTQSETTIRVNPNSGTICSAYNDSQHWAQGNIAFAGFSSSTDGGATFVDHGPFPPGGGGNAFGDPSLIWRQADSHFYYASLHSSGLGLWQSTDDCQTFSWLSMIHTGGGDDKELMEVDNNPASPYFGRIYVGWTDFNAGGQIYVTYSDNGTSWSTPVLVSAGGIDVQGAWPTVAPNGDLYVGWVRWNPYPTGPVDIEIVRSTDGGVSFGPVTNPLTGAVNPRDATATSRCGRPALNADIRYLPSPQIAVGPDGCLHVVYSYDPDGYGAGDVVNVYYRRSCDNGATWGPEVQLNDDGTLTDQWFPTVSVGPSNVVVSTWYDRRLDPGGNFMFDYYKAFSYDGGLTWGANIRVSDVSSSVPTLNPNFDPIVATCYHGDYDQQVQDNAFVYIQWSDDRNIQNGHPDPDVWFEKEPVLAEIGTLTGQVYDAVTMAPIPGADVEAAGGLTFHTVSGGGGIYTMIVAPDTYNVTGSTYGYLPNTIPGVVVLAGGTTVQDIPLTAAPSSVVDGYVTDATTGWPLYASIDTNSPAGIVWTDPETGYYSITLPDGIAFDFHVEAWVPGYIPEDRVVGPLSGNTTEDFALDADPAACIAPGYSPAYSYLEDFEIDDGGYTHSGVYDEWEWGTPTVWPNGCASGNFCWGTDLDGDYENNVDNELLSVVIDLSSVPPGTPLVAKWWQAWHIESATYDHAYAEVSIDGGPWTEMWSHTGATVQVDWTEMSYDISTAAGGTVQFRWRMTSDSSVTYPGYYIDLVSISSGCDPAAGGLVVGNVYDLNTGDGLVGADVWNDSGEATVTAATPADPTVDDGFYTLFSPPGLHDFWATATGYSTVMATVDVGDGTTTRQDFRLGTGYLVWTPTPLEATLDMGASTMVPASLANTGTGDAFFELQEINEGYVPTLISIPRAGGRLPLGDAQAAALASASDSTDVAAFPVVATPSSQTAGTGALLIQDVDAWGYPAITTILASNGIPYDVIGSAQIPTYDFSPYKMIIIPSVQGSGYNTIFNNNLAKFEDFINAGGLMLMSFCEQSSYLPYRLPPFGGTNNYGTESDNYIVDPAHPIFAGVPNPYSGNSASHSYLTDLLPDDRVLVTGGSAPGGNVVMIERDAGGGMLVAGGQTFEWGWANGQGAGLILENMIPHYYYNWEPGGDVPWLSEDPVSGTVPLQGSVPVDVTFDAGVPEITQPGEYYATLKVNNDTIYGPLQVPVTLTVVAPDTYGKLRGWVHGLGYCDADYYPLEEAEVVIEGASGMTWTLLTDQDGYYQIWMDEAESPLMATVTYPEHETGYATGISVVGQQTTTVDFDLRWLRPCVSVAPDSLSASLAMGQTDTQQVTLTNDGAAEANFELQEVDQGFVPTLMVTGPFAEPQALVASEHQEAASAEALGLPTGPEGTLLAAGDVIQSWSSGLGAAWGIAYDGADGTVWVAEGWGNDMIYEYAPDGTPTGRSWLADWNPLNGPADDAFNWNTGMVWTMDVASDDCLHEMDPASGYTGNTICSAAWSISQRGVAYDPALDTWFVGGWNEGIIYHIDSSGTLLDSGFVGLSISGLAYNPETQHLFVMVNASPTWVYVLDASQPGVYPQIGQFAVSEGFADYAGAGLEIDCEGNLWAVDQNTEIVYQFESGETANLCGGDVPWLSEDPISGTIPIDGGTVVVDVTFDAGQVPQPGEYYATLNVNSDDPVNGTIGVPVTLTVSAPDTWGKLTGVVSGLGYCDDNPAPLEGAAVAVVGEITVTSDASGVYVVWLEEGTYTVTASAEGHTSTSAPVTVTGQQTTTQDLDLRSIQPCMSVTPDSMSVVLDSGDSWSEMLTLVNDGAGDSGFKVREMEGGYMPALAAGVVPEPNTRERTESYDPEAVTTAGILSPGGSEPMNVLGAGDILVQWPTLDTLNWGDGFSLIDGMVWINDNAAGGGSGLNEEFDVAGNRTGRNFTPNFGGSWPGDMAFNPNTGMFWQVNVGGDNCIYEWDPAIPGATGNSICGVPWTSISQRGLAYDPTDDTFFIGGWNEDIIYHIQGETGPNPGEVIEQWPVGLSIAGLAHNFEAGQLFVIENSANDTVSQFDVTSGTVVNSFTVSGFGNYVGAGLAIDCGGNLWAVNQGDNNAYLVDSGVPANLCGGDVPWLSEYPTEGDVLADGTFDVEVTFTAPITIGIYTATLLVDTDDAVNPQFQVPVTMTVVECVEVSDVAVSVLTPAPIYPEDLVEFEADIMPDNANKPYTYTIDYDDGTTDEDTSSDDPLAFSHAYTEAGTYMVEVAVWNCEMAPEEAVVGTVEVVVEPVPCTEVVSMTLSMLTPGPIYMGDLVEFEADIVPDDFTAPLSYTIDYGDGSVPDEGLNWADPMPFSHTFVASGTMRVQVEIWNCGMEVPISDWMDVEMMQPMFYVYLPIVVKDSE